MDRKTRLLAQTQPKSPFQPRYDVPAAVVVFLVALPLCLGMALASEAPLFSGIISGTIGGILVGFLSGSHLSVSGPANGLTLIVATGIGAVGGFEAFLCSVVLSGFFQILLSLLRAGSLVSLFPNSVIKGMLAAIGITIILKQVPYALGGFARFESDMEFWHLFGDNSTQHLLEHEIASVNFSALIICIASLIILNFWDSKKIKSHRIFSQIPGALVAVTFAALVNHIFNVGFPVLALTAEDGHLVQLPEVHSFSQLLSEFRFPDFSAFSNKQVWVLGITIAAIASIETLLSIESIDRIDPQKRVSNTNRELFAQGIGNIAAGLLGGIPMTSVIVRSSANMYAGAKSRYATVLHGCILLFSVMALGSILNLIPLASLAAVLLLVGYKLAHPNLFKAMYKNGWDQFLPFLFCIAAILFTDLLQGVLIGLVVGLIFVVKASYYSALVVVKEDSDVLIRFTKDVTFIHKMRLRNVLRQIPLGSRVFFDASRAMFIDRDVYETIQEFKETAANRGITVETRDVVLRKLHDIREERDTKNDGTLQETATRQ